MMRQLQGVYIVWLVSCIFLMINFWVFHPYTTVVVVHDNVVSSNYYYYYDDQPRIHIATSTKDVILQETKRKNDHESFSNSNNKEEPRTTSVPVRPSIESSSSQQQQQQQQQQQHPNRTIGRNKTLVSEQTFIIPNVSSTLEIPLPKSSPLKSCSQEQLGYIQLMLPTSKTLRFLTKCPNAVWIDDWKPKYHEINPKTWSILHEPNPKGRKPVSIYVGCNKAMDAVSTLRSLSWNTTYDKITWRETMKVENSACNQHVTPQVLIPQSSSPSSPGSRDATVYCIEAMPSTVHRLNESIEQLQWGHSLKLHHAAIADTDKRAVMFPNRLVGTEDFGIAHCEQKRFAKSCEEVPQYRLDTFLETFALEEDQNATIDFLSIDVEGFDWPVLLGAPKALDRTKYLEFEYNSVGRWLRRDNNLSTAISYLSQSKGFVCYWAGSSGYLWRMTGCWIDIWDTWKQWSNIACVHSTRAPILADRMESRFIRTLKSRGYRPD